MGSEYVLEMKKINKAFPGVKALKEVDFKLGKGEVHTLLGENGAGKSTLIKILSGAYKKDSGQVLIDGKEVEIENTKQAMKLGVSVIYQEFNLNPFFNIAENIFLGREIINKSGTINWKKTHEKAKKIINKVGLNVPTSRKVRSLSVAEKQLLEIAKALAFEAKIIVFDEPTATLAQADVKRLFQLINNLKNQGKSIIYISHRMEEIKVIGDKTTILRDGEYISTVDPKTTPRSELIRLIAGRTIDESLKKVPEYKGEVVLKVKNLKAKEKVRDVSFELKRGEILGFSGLVGSGRTETMKAIVGLNKIIEGQIFLDGKEVKYKNPCEALKDKIIYLSEDRKQEGLVLCLSVMDNITISSLSKLMNKGILSKKIEKKVASKYIDNVRIKTSSEKVRVENLSGGNQQKVIVAKALASDSAVLIFDEPTRGIDVGAKEEIYDLLLELANKGYAIIAISSDLPEILRISNRIAVMYDGKISAILPNENIKQEDVLHYAMGDWQWIRL